MLTFFSIVTAGSETVQVTISDKNCSKDNCTLYENGPKTFCRYNPLLELVGNFIYYGFGTTPNYSEISDLWRFSLNTFSWEEVNYQLQEPFPGYSKWKSYTCRNNSLFIFSHYRDMCMNSRTMLYELHLDKLILQPILEFDSSADCGCTVNSIAITSEWLYYIITRKNQEKQLQRVSLIFKSIRPSITPSQSDEEDDLDDEEDDD